MVMRTSAEEAEWSSIRASKSNEFEGSLSKALSLNVAYKDFILREAYPDPNTPYAAATIAKTSNAKVALDAEMDRAERIVNDIQAVVDAQKQKLQRRNYTIAQKEDNVNMLSQKVQEGTVLSNIRREQVEALRKKYASNLHSSWLGLWRPLDETSRFGIFVAAIAFGCIAALSIVYLVKYTSLPGSPVKPTSTSTSTGASLFGGFRKRFLKD